MMEEVAVPDKKKLKKMFSWTDDTVYVNVEILLIQRKNDKVQLD